MKTMSFRDLVENFVTVTYSSRSTQENMRHYLKWFERFLQEIDKSVDEVSHQDIINFRRWLSEQRSRLDRKLSAGSIQQILCAVKSFYNFLESIGYSNPFKSLPVTILKKLNPRVKIEKVPREFTEKELSKIFDYLSKRNNDVYLACLLALTTGARLNEILNIRVEDIIKRGNNLLIIIRAGKGLKERIVFIGIPYQTLDGKVFSKVLRELNHIAIKQLREKLKKVKRGYLFGDETSRKRLRKNIQQTLYRLSKKLGIEIHFHNFRSNWGAKALLAGTPLEYVSHQLGHKYTSTTERYYARIKDTYVIEFLSSLILKK